MLGLVKSAPPDPLFFTTPPEFRACLNSITKPVVNNGSGFIENIPATQALAGLSQLMRLFVLAGSTACERRLMYTVTRFASVRGNRRVTGAQLISAARRNLSARTGCIRPGLKLSHVAGPTKAGFTPMRIDNQPRCRRRVRSGSVLRLARGNFSRANRPHTAQPRFGG